MGEAPLSITTGVTRYYQLGCPLAIERSQATHLLIGSPATAYPSHGDIGRTKRLGSPASPLNPLPRRRRASVSASAQRSVACRFSCPKSFLTARRLTPARSLVVA
jgi:hypothetical protein